MVQCSRRLGAASLGALVVLSAYSFQPSLAQSPASATVALTGARVIDGTGRPPRDQATILIVNGRIESVGAGADVKIPSGATRVNLTGKTVLPGMINAHGHSANGDKKLPVRDQVVQQMRLYAQYGVTTVVTLGDDGKESVRVHDENGSPSLDHARLFSAGPAVVARNADEARQLVNANADLGVHVIKTRMNGVPSDMTPEVYSALIDQAHKRGLRVACHLFYLHEAMGMVNAGLDVIGHSIRDQDVDASFIAELKRRDVSYVPTLTRDLAVFVYESTPAFLSDPFFLKGVTFTRGQLDQVKDPAFQQRVAQSGEAQMIKKALDQASRNLKILSDGGVRIAMGTDSGTQVGRWQGYFEHVELEMMVKAGMTPMQVLVAATSGSAAAMKLDQLGAIQPGKQADLLVLNADPLTDIRNTRQIHSVWVGGRRLAAGVGTN
jgi:imidazolonepropionase-like amidohydrolase